jgi:hypothetical protein
VAAGGAIKLPAAAKATISATASDAAGDSGEATLKVKLKSK